MNHAEHLVNDPILKNNIVTKREKEILTLMSEGKTDVRIAKQLFISPYTVNTHRKNLLQKFYAKNSCHLMYLACTNGVL